MSECVIVCCVYDGPPPFFREAFLFIFVSYPSFGGGYTLLPGFVLRSHSIITSGLIPETGGAGDARAPDVCGRMLTYAAVCCRMLTHSRRRWCARLTYADVF